MDRGAWWATVHSIITGVGHDLATRKEKWASLVANQGGKKLCITAHNTQVALVVKNLPANARDIKRHGFNPWLGKNP